MKLEATIDLRPSFHSSHTWPLDANGDTGILSEHCDRVFGYWDIDGQPLLAAPEEVRHGRFPDGDYNRMGFDGITVNFRIKTNEIDKEKTIWCPACSICPEYAALVRWCREGLYRHSGDSNRILLEQLYSYFHDWGIPVRHTESGISIIGRLLSGKVEGLERCFEEATGFRKPVVDMRNFENMGSLMYPVFRRFYKRKEGCRRLVNARSFRQLVEAGILESRMTLVQD